VVSRAKNGMIMGGGLRVVVALVGVVVMKSNECENIRVWWTDSKLVVQSETGMVIP